VNLWMWINDLFKMVGIAPVKKRMGYGYAYMIGTLLEGVYMWFSIEKEPPMTRFLAEQLARSHWFSIDRARRDLGYQPRLSTSEGLERLAQWLLQQD